MRRSYDSTKILEFIRRFIEKSGYAPTIGEIQRGLGISSKSVVDRHLNTLEKEGHIKRSSQVTRGINVSGIGVETVITRDRWRLSRFLNFNEGQLFNLENDPDEQNNLYNIPEFSQKKLELLEKLVKLAARPRNHENYRNFAIKKGDKEHFGKTVPVYPAMEGPRY